MNEPMNLERAADIFRKHYQHPGQREAEEFVIEEVRRLRVEVERLERAALVRGWWRRASCLLLRHEYVVNQQYQGHGRWGWDGSFICQRCGKVRFRCR